MSARCLSAVTASLFWVWMGISVAEMVSIGLTAVYSIACTVVILVALRAVMGSLRVNEDEEAEGLDLALHSESAYTDLSGGSLVGGAFGHGERRTESAALTGVAATRESATAGAL